MEIATHILFIAMIIFCVYGNVKLWRCRNEMFIQKRSAVFGVNVAFILIIIGWEILIICYVYYPPEMTIIPTTMMLTSCWFLFCMLIAKNWMNYFKTKWTQYTMEFEWQRIINPNVLSQKSNRAQNWFIENNKTFGNPSFVYKLIGMLCFFGFSLSLIPNILTKLFASDVLSAFASSALLLSFGSIIISYAIIISKTPSFNDAFYIQWENKMHSKLLICLVMTMMIFFVLSYSLNVEWSSSAPFFAMIWCAMNYVSTFSIYKKNKCANRMSALSIQSLSDSISLEMILSNSTAVHLFMVYLSSEYVVLICIVYCTCVARIIV